MDHFARKELTFSFFSCKSQSLPNPVQGPVYGKLRNKSRLDTSPMEAIVYSPLGPKCFEKSVARFIFKSLKEPGPITSNCS